MAKNKSLFLTFFLILSFVCNFVFADERFKKKPEITATNWIDHFTFSLPQTALGLIAFPIQMIAGASSNNLDLHFTKKQFHITSPSLTNSSFSLGFFQFGEKKSEDHEDAHSHQSAVLGPLYLPIIGIDYLIEFHNRGTTDNTAVENWANSWKYLENKTFSVNPFGGHFEFRKTDDQQPQLRLSFLTSMNEDLSRIRIHNPNGKDKDHVQVQSKYGTLESGWTTSLDGCGRDGSFVDFSIFKRSFNGDIYFVPDWLAFIMKSDQTLGEFSYDSVSTKTDLGILLQKYGVGLRIGREDILALDALGLGGMDVKANFASANMTAPLDNQGLVLSGMLGAGAKLHILDSLQLYGGFEEEFGTGEYQKSSKIIGIQTPMFKRNDSMDSGIDQKKYNPVPLQGSAEYRKQTESIGNGPERSIDSFHFVLEGFIP